MPRVSDLSKTIREFKSDVIDKENLNRNKVNDIVRKTILNTVKAMFNTNTDRRFKELFDNFNDIEKDLKITDDRYRMSIFASKDFPIEIDIGTKELEELASGNDLDKVEAMQSVMMDIVSCTQEFYEKITNQNYVYTKNDKSLNETYKSASLEIGDNFSLQLGNGENPLNAQKRNCNRIANKIVTIEMLKAFSEDNIARTNIFNNACNIMNEIDDEEISEYSVDGKVYRVSNEEEIIANNPNLIEDYSILNYGYNGDGTRKTLAEIFDYAEEQKRNLTDEGNIDQVNEITAMRVVEELKLSSNPNAEIAQLINKYGREEAIKKLNDVNFTMDLLKNQQELKKKLGNEITDKYTKELENIEDYDNNGEIIPGAIDEKKQKYLDFVSEGDYDRIYANININIIEKTKDDEQQDKPNANKQILNDNREIDKLIDLIKDEQEFNQQKIDELIEQNNKEREDRDNFVKNLLNEYKNNIEEINNTNEKNIQNLKDNYDENLSKKDEEINNLNGKITELMKDTEEKINKEKEESEQKIEELKREYEDKDIQKQEEIDKQIEDIKNEYNNNIKEIQEEYQNERESIKEELEIAKQEKLELEKRMDSLDNSLNEKEKQIDILNKEVEDNSRENEQLKNELNVANDKIDEQNNEIQDKNITINELVNKVQSLEDEKKDIQDKFRETEIAYKAALKNNNDELAKKLENNKNELYDKIEELNQNVKSLKNETKINITDENVNIVIKEEYNYFYDSLSEEGNLSADEIGKIQQAISYVESKVSDLRRDETISKEELISKLNLVSVRKELYKEAYEKINEEKISQEKINDIDFIEVDYEIVKDEVKELPSPSYIELGVPENSITSDNQINISQWQEIKSEQDKKAVEENNNPKTYTKEDNVTIEDVIKEQEKKKAELYSKPLSETQMHIDDLENNNYDKNEIENKVENKIVENENFISKGREKFEKDVQEVTASHKTNQEKTDELNERVTAEKLRQEFNSLQSEEKSEFLLKNPEFYNYYRKYCLELRKVAKEKVYEDELGREKEEEVDEMIVEVSKLKEKTDRGNKLK